MAASVTAPSILRLLHSCEGQNTTTCSRQGAFANRPVGHGPLVAHIVVSVQFVQRHRATKGRYNLMSEKSHELGRMFVGPPSSEETFKLMI